MIKKVGIGIGLFLFFVTVGFYHQVHAEAPNAKECIEGNADCPELDESIPNEVDSNKVTEKDNDSLVFTMIKMVVSLLIVLALIYALLKFLNKRNKSFQKVKAMENLGGISVGPNKSIQIVRIGSKVYLIGVGDNVEMLHEVTDQEVIHDLLQNNESGEFQASALFTNLFKQRATTDEEVINKKNDFKKMFSSELEKLKNGRKKIIDNYKNKEDKHE